MFCSSCGMAVSPSLSYCNRCGAEVNVKGTPSKEDAPTESLVWALAVVTIVGIGAVIGLMAVMKEVVHFNNDLVLGLTLLTFLAFLGVDAAIIWLLLRPRRDSREAYFRARQKELTTNELADSRAGLLAEPSFGVTDHTTHTLEPAEPKRRLD